MNNKPLNKKESCIHKDNVGIPDYPVDKKSGVGVHSIENKENASGLPAPEYPVPVCGSVDKKAEKLQEVHCAVNVSSSLKSASSAQQKHSSVSLVAGDPEQKPVAFLNKKKNRQILKKRRLIKNNFIDDEAEEEDAEDDDDEEEKNKEEDFEKDEYDLNDPFINDKEEDEGEEINYNEINKKIEEFPDNNIFKYIKLNPNKYLEIFKEDNCLQFNNDLKND